MKIAALWTLVALLLVSMSLAGGCSLDEMVRVDVPPNTREHFRTHLDTAVPPELSLRDARILRQEGDRKWAETFEAIAADHQASNDALDHEITDGSFIEGLIGSAVNTGVEAYLPGLGALPGGAILTTLLAGLGMWLVPRPGESKREKQAEDKGYDMGRSETVELLSKTTPSR